MNSNPDSEKPKAAPSRCLSNCVRFAVAQVMMAIYWPACVILIIVVCMFSGIFLSKENHRILGQKMLSLTLGGFITMLEWFGIIRVHDDDLKRHLDTPDPLILACNHPALWDAPLIIRRIGRLSGIMKAELLANPLLRHGARFAGFLPNSPRMTMIRASLERLSTGGRLLFFPEGTRTREENGAVNPFRPGLALIAKESGVPIIPVFIRQDSPYLRKYWPIIRMPELPITISLSLGEPVRALPDESVRAFSERLENIFRNELE
ncbi:MAG: lysophospholipid acyltransferase family protein [Luteolibacter sp.]